MSPETPSSGSMPLNLSLRACRTIAIVNEATNAAEPIALSVSDREIQARTGRPGVVLVEPTGRLPHGPDGDRRVERQRLAFATTRMFLSRSWLRIA